jgi:DNA-binding transcriptional MocR family regulator
MEELKNKLQKNTHWFKFGRVIIDRHAKYLGPITLAVYVSIKRHSDADRIAFPSHELMAEELNTSTRTVLRHCKYLVAHNLIQVKKVKYKGRWRNNTYYLTYTKQWQSSCDIKSHRHCKNTHLPRDA